MKSNALDTSNDTRSAIELNAPTWRASDATLEAELAHADSLRRQASSSLARAAGHADELLHRGLERARYAGAQMREQATRTGELTVGYVRQEPVKAMVFAAAAGATLAVLASLLVRPRR